jgi:rhamnulose-1-phosphate aldolase
VERAAAKKIDINDAVTKQIERATETAQYLWSRGWAERNGGNISLNLTDIIGRLPNDFTGFRHVQTTDAPPDAAGKVFFVTGTQARLRELTRPAETGCILRYNDDCSGYHLLWGGNESPDFRPTSEFVPHVRVHLDKLASGSNHRAVLHTHPIELICMTHHPGYHDNEEAMNNAIWSMLPEVRVFVPRGIGITLYTLPGSGELADLTVKALQKHDVALWNKHGAVATGRDALEAFDYIDVANKGATIFLKCLASGFKPLGMTRDELDELVQTFDL